NPETAWIILLVQNEKGYKSLLKIFQRYYMAQGKESEPHLTMEELCEFNDGLILLSGGATGILGAYVLQNRPDYAKQTANRLKEVFGSRFYMEISRTDEPEEAQTEQAFLNMAYELNIPLVATNEAFYATPDMYEAHDALMCIGQKTYVDEVDRKRLSPEHYLKSQEQMQELFADLPEALENTVKIAKRCGFMVEFHAPEFPRYDCHGKTEDEVLREKSEAGLKMRMQGREQDFDKYNERLQYELSVIEKMKFPGYFLIVADFIQWSKAHGVPVGPGRGSGAGSVVAWCLTITNIDPLRFNLLFERFLNPERVNMPDFDVDFCQEKREMSIKYVQNNYGFDHVAQIITFGQLQPKAVIRDVGRVLQIPYPVVDKLSKLVPNGLNEKGKPFSLTEAIQMEPAIEIEANNNPQIKHLLELALQLEGLYRNTSTHAAGVVIGRFPLDEILPIYKDPASDMPVTQYNMKYVESTGLIKFDFLGLKTLTTLAKTMELLKNRGIEFDLDNIPLDDKDTFKLLCDADTSGIFQLESAGMRKILKDLAPDKIEDIVAIVALYRPGPMGNIPSYIARKHGQEEPDYLHPLLEGILKETYGIMIYQEQVMQIAQVLAGFSLGGADLLRRAMGKKKFEVMQQQKVIFIEGAKKNGVSEEKATEIFDLMEKFASYGFNKSHAAAYAFVSYQTAYLKAHYPVEFMAATMTLDKIDTDKLGFFKREIAKMGIKILPPDVNKSGVNFTVEDGAIRYALSALKNVGDAAMQDLVQERDKNGVYKDIQDFIARSTPALMNKRAIENLIKSGAMDSLDKNRAKLLANVEKMGQHSASLLRQKQSAQASLFGGQAAFEELKMTEVPDYPQMEKLDLEREAVGFYLSAHPLDAYIDSFERLRINSSAEIEPLVNSAGSIHLRLAGIVNEKRERISQKTGNKFAFITASDTYGTFDCLCFSDTLTQSREMLDSGKPLIFSLIADKKEDEIRMSLQNVEYLTDSVAKVSEALMIYVENEKCLTEIKKVLSEEKKGRGRILFVAPAGDYSVEVELPTGYTISGNTINALSRIAGVSLVKQI
ncbi:MAG: DNA polymerase III subunit alpha, partial [Alphaproteobacteria bacterium]